MESKKIVILGAGVGGLAIGKLLCDDNVCSHIIYEKSDKLPLNFQNGVHYLHSIPTIKSKVKYKSIRLDEAIFDDKGHLKKESDLNDAVIYSLKATGFIQPSSIFALGKKTECYVPESNNANDIVEDLAEFCNVQYNWTCLSIDTDKKEIVVSRDGAADKVDYDYLVSTIPLNFLMGMTGIEHDKNDFQWSPINTYNFDVENIKKDWLIVVYIARNDFKSYRMTIIDGIASVESTEKMRNDEVVAEVKQVFKNFSIDFESYTEGKWETGKILSISKEYRKRVLDELIQQDILSFGRYGLWDRKLLIDSTIKQAQLIDKYIKGDKVDKEGLVEGLL